MDKRTGQERWKALSDDASYSAPIVIDQGGKRVLVCWTGIYGADNRGVLRCLRLTDGQQVWEDRSAVSENRFATIHLIRHGDRTWLVNERGELIIAELTPLGFHELSRAKLLDPTLDQLRKRNGVTWSHPAFATGTYSHAMIKKLIGNNGEVGANLKISIVAIEPTPGYGYHFHLDNVRCTVVAESEVVNVPPEVIRNRYIIAVANPKSAMADDAPRGDRKQKLNSY